MKTLGAVMIVKNEERCLERCLRCIQPLVDKIYITDTGSSDRTAEIAESFGAQVSHFTWVQDFAAARNFALAQSDCDWNLVLDADEYLISGSRSDLQPFLETGKAVGVILRHDLFRDEDDSLSCAYSHTTRLIPKGTQYTGKIHEQVQSALPRRPIPLTFEHDGYLQTGKGERNLEILLKELENAPNDSYYLYQTAKTLTVMKDYERALPYFCRFYAVIEPDSGCRTDGILSYLTTLIELKLFDEGLALIMQEEDALNENAEFYFTTAHFCTKAAQYNIRKYMDLIPLIEQSYLRCLEIGEHPENGGVLGQGSFLAAYNLGVVYEVHGQISKAEMYFRQSAALGYSKAARHLKQLHEEENKK